MKVIEDIIDPEAVREHLSALVLRRRGADPDDSYEGWLPTVPDAWSAIDAAAADYAGEMRAQADKPTAILHAAYWGGMACPDHIDQYFGRPGTRDTGDRTVSVSYIVERAARGGEMVLRDHARSVRHEVNPPAGSVILFPADWWHEVLPVHGGIRRSLVRWYAQSNGRRFTSRAVLTG